MAENAAPDIEAMIFELSMAARVYGRLDTHAALAKMEVAEEALRRHIAGLRWQADNWKRCRDQEQALRIKAESALAALQMTVAEHGNGHSHQCVKCSHAYTPAPEASEDCPVCMHDGSALKTKEPTNG